MSWNTGTLKDLIFFQRGFDITKAEQKPGNIPVISSSGISSYHSEAMVSGPGVIIGRKGTLGSVHYSADDYWPHDTTLWSKDLKGNNAKYVYYFLKTMRLENYNVGNANPTLNRNHIHDLEIRIPDKNIQDRIADILSAYDDLIKNNRHRIDLLEQSARLLYKEWFVSLRFPGHEHVKVKDGVPQGWEIRKIEDLGEIVTGKTPSTKEQENYDGDIPFVKTPDMHTQIVVTKTEQQLSERGAKLQEKKFLPKGAVMVSCIGTVGVVAIAGSRCQTNQQINSVVCHDPMFNYYAYYALLDLKPRLESMSGGVTMPNVNKSKFSVMPIMIPDKKIVSLFDEAVVSNFVQIETLSIMNEKLQQARDLLLPRLMNGEIPV